MKNLRRLATAALIGAFAASGLSATAVSAKEELNILTWEGYAEDLWIEEFEKTHDVKVNRTYVGSNDEYMAKLAAGGGDYDVVTIVSSLAQAAISAGFVEPLDLDKLSNYDQIFEGFRNSTVNKKGDEVYGVPTFWGTSPVTVSAEVPADADFSVLFDPKYAGKISMWDDVSTIGDVANYLGYENLWTLSDEQLEEVKKVMIKQKPLIRKYWSNAGEVIELFASGEIVASNSWNYITQALIAEGHDVREFVPGRAIGWMDSNFVIKGTENADLAHQFIDHLIAAESQGKIAGYTGYTVTNPDSKAYMSAETWDMLYMDEAEEILENMAFWEEIPRRSRYLEVWSEIKAATAE